MLVSQCSLLATLIRLTKKLRERIGLQREGKPSTSSPQSAGAHGGGFTGTFFRSPFTALVSIIKEWGTQGSG